LCGIHLHPLPDQSLIGQREKPIKGAASVALFCCCLSFFTMVFDRFYSDEPSPGGTEAAW
ncbi:MAG: hypothetical protein WCH30_07860, partial [Chlorobiaceae bacterium]